MSDMEEIRYRLPPDVSPSSGDQQFPHSAHHGPGTGAGIGRQKTNFDYQNLHWLLQTRDEIAGTEGTDEAHQFFMKNYECMLIRPLERCEGEPLNLQRRMQMKKREKKKKAAANSLNRSSAESASLGVGYRSSIALPPLVIPSAIGTDNLSLLSDQTVGHVTHASGFPPILPPNIEETLSHDIRDWLPLLHNSKKHINPVRLREQKLKKIRKILHKMPFERNSVDIDEINEGLKLFPLLTKQVSPAVLHELCAVAQIDEWQEPDVTIFGTTGFHIILRDES